MELEQTIAAPEIVKSDVTPTTKLELVPILSELVIVPLVALLTKFTMVVTDVLLPPAIP